MWTNPDKENLEAFWSYCFAGRQEKIEHALKLLIHEMILGFDPVYCGADGGPRTADEFMLSAEMIEEHVKFLVSGTNITALVRSVANEYYGLTSQAGSDNNSTER